MLSVDDKMEASAAAAMAKTLTADSEARTIAMSRSVVVLDSSSCSMEVQRLAIAHKVLIVVLEMTPEKM